MLAALDTPLGEIRVYINGEPAEFEAAPVIRDVASLKEDPPAGCVRLTVPCVGAEVVRCALTSTDGIEASGASDERFLCSEFVRDDVILTIGAEDENPDFETLRVPGGMEYRLAQHVGKMVFSVAWLTDYRGDHDIRTYLAADIF